MKRILTVIFVFSFVLSFNIVAQQQTMKVASYNLRVDTPRDVANGNGWLNRYPVVANMVLFHDWDIIGTQECKTNQINDLQNVLKVHNYEVIGRSREEDPVEGEFSAIFYKANRYELIENGDFWLSETPCKASKGWDAAFNRICSWGHFKEIATGFEFYVFNMHFDHRGVEARLKSAELVVQKVKSIAKGKTTILTGDFNVDQYSDSYTTFATSGFLTDSYTLAPIILANNGTFNSFNVDGTTHHRIDHIFVTNDLQVNRYGVLTDLYWSDEDGEPIKSRDFPDEVKSKNATPRLPSDHYPVVVELQY